MVKKKLGIDLGGTKIEAVVMQANNEISHRMRVDTPKNSYQETIETIKRLVIDIELTAGIDDPLPLGIGTPGSVSFFGPMCY